MIIFIFFILAVLAFDIITFKDKTKNVIIAYIALAIIAFGLGLFYFQDIYKPSFSYQILNLFRINY